MFSGRRVLIVIVIFLLIGLVASVVLSLRTTNKNSSATGENNLNTSSQITPSKNSSVNDFANLSKENTGTLTFSVISTGANTNLKSFVIRVVKIEAYSKSGAFSTLTMPLPISVDLAALENSGVANMGQTVLLAQNYSEIRVYIDKATIISKDGKKSDLVVTDATGVVRVTKDFSIEKQKNTNLNLDFVLDKSYLNNNFTPFIANLLVSH